MSYYQGERHRSTKERRPRDDYYSADPDPHYKGARETSLVRRHRDDSFSSVEEVKRDFSPGSRRTGGRARSVGGRDRYGNSYDHGSYYDDGYPSSSKHGTKRHHGKGRPRRRGSYSDSSGSRSPPRRRKSMGEQALAALGLGGVAAAAAAGKARDRSRSRRRRDSSSSSSHSRSRRGRGKPQTKEEVARALKAAFLAGATEAVRSRKQPGGWAGEKGKRVLTAAISAGGVNDLINEKDSKFKTVGSVLAGLGTNRLVNGTRSRSRSRARIRDGRGRARSESRSRLKDLAGAGLMTAAGTSIYNRVRSKSRGRGSSSSSFDSYDSRRAPRRREKKKRSSSISAIATKGLAALGLAEPADKRHKRRSATFDDDDNYYREDYHNEDYRRGRNGVPPPYGGGGYSDPRDVGQPRSVGNGDMLHKDANGVDLSPHHFGDSETDSDSDLGNSSDDERRLKKARATQMITAGLASVATVHAGHSVYQSMKARGERYKAVAEGEITPGQARREKKKNHMQDAVSIGIAALGIKGAMSEWKEMKEKHQAAVELKQKQERHRAKREARRRKLLSMGMQEKFAGSAPTFASPENAFSPGGGPTYFDGNPYDAAHHPPAAHPPYIPPPPPGPPPASF